MLTLVFGCSRPALRESESNVKYLSNELDKSLFESKLKVNEIGDRVAERIGRENENYVYIKSHEVLDDTEKLLDQLDSFKSASDIPSEFLEGVNELIQEKYSCRYENKVVLHEDSPIDIKFSLITDLELKLSCLQDSIGSSDVSISLSGNFNPLNKEIDSVQRMLLKEKGLQENIFIPSSLLNQISVYPININSSYIDFVRSALVGETSTWLQINEMVNNFPFIQSEGDNLSLTHQLQPCPWNSSNHLLLVNVINNSENDKFIKDLTIVLNSRTVNEIRLLGFENPDKKFTRKFIESISIPFRYGESFTMFYEVNLKDTNQSIGEIILSFQNDLEGRFMQISETINSIDDKASNEFIFLASIVETTLFLNDSRYQSNANLQEVEKRLVDISPFLKSKEQKEFLQLLRLYIKAQTEETSF